MFGRHPRLAIDAFLGLNSDSLNSTSQTKYMRKLRDRLSFAYQKAREVSKKAGSRHRLNYDLPARSSVLRIGDRVLVKNAGIRGRCKLADRWEKNPYIAIDQPNDDIPVYRIKREGARSKTRFLHRNFLLPFIGYRLMRKMNNWSQLFLQNQLKKSMSWAKYNLSMPIWICCQIQTRRQPMMEVQSLLFT